MGSAQVQGRLWGAVAADWAQLTEPAMAPVYEAVLDELRVGADTRLVTAAGLAPVRAGEAPAPFSYPDLDTAVRANLATGPARQAIEHAGLDATTDGLRSAFAEYRHPDGTARKTRSGT